MSDIAMAYAGGAIDLDLLDGGAAVDEGLMTAVIVSLFTDRRANASDALPDGADDRRGWWGDIHPEADLDRIGSRLWLLGREKQLISVVRRAEEYAREALAWLVEDRVAARVEVAGSVPAAGVLALAIAIHRPTGERVDIRFDNLWEALHAL